MMPCRRVKPLVHLYGGTLVNGNVSRGWSQAAHSRGTQFPHRFRVGGSRHLPLNLHTPEPPLGKKIGRNSSPDYGCKMYQNQHAFKMRKLRHIWNWGQVRRSKEFQVTAKHNPQGPREIDVFVGKGTLLYKLENVNPQPLKSFRKLATFTIPGFPQKGGDRTITWEPMGN